MSRLEDLVRFYALLDRQAACLGGARLLSALDLKVLPNRGVYFFFEPGQSRSDSGAGPRVVRVGTHGLGRGSKSTLAQRLGQHRGTNSGGGNHRGSIFRLLLGQALIASGGVQRCRSWGVKSDIGKAAATLGMSREAVKEDERAPEQAVSRHIGAMRVLWIEVDDNPGPASQRAYIETNAIALLSNFEGRSLDPASHAWLGVHSNRHRVRESGLWNQNHVDQSYDSSFLAELEDLIARPGGHGNMS